MLLETLLDQVRNVRDALMELEDDKGLTAARAASLLIAMMHDMEEAP